MTPRKPALPGKLAFGWREAMKKPKLRFVALAVLVLAASIIGGVVAWLSDGATAKREITTGNVDIRLVDEAWNADLARNVKPNTFLPRSPKVTNLGSNDAYVFITLEIAALPEGTELHSGTGMARSGVGTPLYTTQAASGLAYDNADWTWVSGGLRDGRITQVYAYARNNAMVPLRQGQTTPSVFDRVRLANVDSVTALIGVDPSITVSAYGIQATELGSAGGITSPLDVWNIVSNYQNTRK